MREFNQRKPFNESTGNDSIKSKIAEATKPAGSCRFFASKEGCKAGKRCRFNHVPAYNLSAMVVPEITFTRSVNTKNFDDGRAMNKDDDDSSIDGSVKHERKINHISAYM